MSTLAGTHRDCSWCGKTVRVGVIVANVVTYHALCWERRACLVEPACGSGSWGGQRPGLEDYATGLVRQTFGQKEGVQAF